MSACNHDHKSTIDYLAFNEVIELLQTILNAPLCRRAFMDQYALSAEHMEDMRRGVQKWMDERAKQPSCDLDIVKVRAQFNRDAAREHWSSRHLSLRVINYKSTRSTAPQYYSQSALKWCIKGLLRDDSYCAPARMRQTSYTRQRFKLKSMSERLQEQEHKVTEMQGALADAERVQAEQALQLARREYELEQREMARLEAEARLQDMEEQLAAAEEKEREATQNVILMEENRRMEMQRVALNINQMNAGYYQFILQQRQTFEYARQAMNQFLHQMNTAYARQLQAQDSVIQQLVHHHTELQQLVPGVVPSMLSSATPAITLPSADL